MNSIKLKYKRETGNSAYLTCVESKLMVDSLDAIMLEGMTADEIIDVIQYDNRHNMTWCVEMNSIPPEYKDGDDLCLVSPEYIKWLEEQLTELNNERRNG